jgi:hypothetical protein
VNAALIGLAGVVIGGAIAAFVQLRSSARNVRGAARLVREELGQSATYLESVPRTQQWPALGQALASDVWLDVRSLLADELGRQDWLAVNNAYRAVDAIRPLASKRLPSLEHPVPDQSIKEIDAACSVLDALSGPFPSITQTWRRRRRG